MHIRYQRDRDLLRQLRQQVVPDNWRTRFEDEVQRVVGGATGIGIGRFIASTLSVEPELDDLRTGVRAEKGFFENIPPVATTENVRLRSEKKGRGHPELREDGCRDLQVVQVSIVESERNAALQGLAGHAGRRQGLKRHHAPCLAQLRELCSKCLGRDCDCVGVARRPGDTVIAENCRDLPPRGNDTQLGRASRLAGADGDQKGVGGIIVRELFGIEIVATEAVEECSDCPHVAVRTNLEVRGTE